ncbi:60S ribosomal export protein NMD3 [Methanooceanicella nereidis]|nr:60S ribosomal export protein NMD3 [Methanocella sp. CWC-04]
MTSGLFCPKCGKETEAEGLCTACFREEHVLFEVPQVLEVKICAKCPSYKVGEQWIDTKLETYEDLVKKATIKIVDLAVKMNKEAESPRIKIFPEFINPNVLRVRVQAEAYVLGRHMSDEKEVEVRVRKETCDICSRIAGGYYEGIIQVRAQNRFPTKKEMGKALKIIYDVVKKAEKAGDRLAFVTDEFDLPEGVDVYMGSVNCSRQASRAIVDDFGGTVLESPKLVGAKDGKDLYRVTFAVRIPEIVAGDIVNMHGKVVLVEKVGKRISGTELSSGHSTSAPEDVKLEKLSNRSEAMSTVLVSEEGNSVQILDPVTYEPMTIKKPIFLTRSPGDEIWVVKINNDVFLLPGGNRGKE